ncbi:hypothetical protein ACNF42_02755 [Cuniculiplasma sp. SKW3]|uniref:hypothetical protein n=1 Tax=Cuniculiplasma sp. SKW3 TaxID=3400170 RepID=UPI003FD65C72
MHLNNQAPEWYALGVSVRLDYSIFNILSGVDYTMRSVIISDGENIKVISYIPENLKEISKFSIFLRSINAKELNGVYVVSYEDRNDPKLMFFNKLVNIEGVIITQVYSDKDGFHLYCKFPVFLNHEISKLIIEACSSIPNLEVEQLADVKKIKPFKVTELDRDIYRIELQASYEVPEECEGEIETDNLRMDRVILLGQLSCNSIPGCLAMEKEIGYLQKYEMKCTLSDILLAMVRENILTYRRVLRIKNRKISMEIVTPKNNINTILKIISDLDRGSVEIISIGKIKWDFNS